jgi:hypothetical protein
VYELLESTAEKCRIRLHRGKRTPFEYTLTMAQCVQAGWNKTSSGVKPLWAAIPHIMLKNRCVSNGIRAFSPASEFASMGMAPEGTDTFDEQEVADPAPAQPITVTVTGAQVKVEETPVASGDQEQLFGSEPVDAEYTMGERRTPPPGVGYSSWPEAMRRSFEAQVAKLFGNNRAEAHAEFGVNSFKEWCWSTDDTRTILTVIEAGVSKSLTYGDIKKALGIEIFADIPALGLTIESATGRLDVYVAEQANG